MTTETQTEFARRLQRDRSHVTRLKQAGRLVLSANGRIEVEASLARIEATRGTRFDVEARWAGSRPEPSQESIAPPPSEIADSLSTDEIGRRTRLAQMRKEEAEAHKRELELDELTGDLLRRLAVEKAMADAVALILSAGENLPDRLAPQLVGISEMERIRARLKDAMEELFATVAAELGRLQREDRQAAA